MAYTPSTLTIASWTVPISIVGTDTLASLDNTVNAIIDTDASSAKAYLNTELAKIPTYLSGEMTSIYNDLAGQVNVIAGLTSSAAELNILDGATLSTAELNLLDGVTATTSELNIVDGLTATTSELNLLDGVTATTTELNILDGVTATTAEINYVDGVTSNVQTQLDSKASITYVDGQDIGIGQTWQDVSGTRSTGVTYTNTTGKPIEVAISITATASNGSASISVSGVPLGIISRWPTAGGGASFGSVVIPTGATYIVTASGATINTWVELR